jgi:hypothetical protein
MPVSVTVSLSSLTGSALEGAYVSAKLYTQEDLNDGVVSKEFEDSATTDASGEAVLSLYPNTLTDAVSYYRVRAWHPTDRRKIIDRAVCVPNWDSLLADLEYSSWPPTGAVCTAASVTQLADTDYLFIPTSGYDGDLLTAFYQSGFIVTVVGGLSLTAAEYVNAAATQSSWVPGVTDSVIPFSEVVGTNQVLRSYVANNTVTTEDDISDSEIAVLSALGVPNGWVGYEKTDFYSYTITDPIGAGDDTCSMDFYDTITVRQLPSFVVEDGSGNQFTCRASFAVAPTDSNVRCLGAVSNGGIIFRAYPV